MVVRATLCRSGAEQMRADADEAVRLLSAGSLLTPTPALMQGIARILCGDLDGGDLSLQDAVSIGEQVDSPAAVAAALGERSLIAMARSEWDRAEALTDQAGTVLRQAGIEESFATPLVRAMRARMALHRGDAQAARRELVSAQHPRRLLTYALPHLAVQARIELIRAHLALADLAGARTLMREVDDLLRRRPGLGNLVAEAETLRTMLATARGWGSAWPEHRPWMPGPSRCFKSGRRWPSGRRHPAWNGAPAARWRRARPRRRSPTCCWRSPRWSAWAGSSPRWRSPGRGSWAYSKDGDPPSCKALGWTACRNTTRGISVQATRPIDKG